MRAPMLEAIGHFRIDHRLGEGGMGSAPQEEMQTWIRATIG